MSARQTRRAFLRTAGLIAGTWLASGALAACGATPAAQVVEKEVVVTATPEPLALQCAGKVSLGYYTSTTPAIERMKAQEASFHEKAPDVDLEIIQMTSIYDKYAVMMAAGNEPDVIWMGTGFWQFVGLGAFLDLDPLFAADQTIDRGGYYSQVLDLFTWQDKLFALPYGFTTTVYAYNEELLTSAGLSAPAEDWTHDDLVTMGKALVKDTDGDGRIDQFGAGNGGFWQIFWQCIWEFGADVLTPDYSRAAMNTEEAIAGLKFMYDLTYGDHKIAPSPEVLQEISGFPLFNTGKIGFWLLGRFGVPVLREGATAFAWDVAVAPSQKGTWLSGESYCISSRVQDKGAAWCLLKHLCDQDAQRTFYMPEASAIPAIQAVAESEDFMNDGKPPTNDRAFVQSLAFAKHQPTHPIVQQINTICSPIADQMNAGDITPEEAGQMMDDAINVKLHEYEGVWQA